MTSETSQETSAGYFAKHIYRHILISAVFSFLIIGGVAALSVFLEISGAVIATGTVVVESNTKQIQHADGGIVSEILVKNGDLVKAGDLLMQLDATISLASLSIIQNQLDSLRAQEVRLIAERDNRASMGNSSQQGMNEEYRNQQMLFHARRSSLTERKNQLEEQVNQLLRQIEGLRSQLSAKEEEISYIQVELSDMSKLYGKKLIQRNRVTALKRESAKLKGQHGELIAQIAKTGNEIIERKIQIVQAREGYRADVLEQLNQVRFSIAKLEEQKITAEDELSRVEITAPLDGYIHQLSVHTIGAVIAPATTIMLIVPKEDLLVVEAKVQPTAIDQLGDIIGAKVRFPSFDQRTTPELEAKLVMVSPDLSVDDKTGQGFYMARLMINEDSLEQLGDKRLVPGMPAEVFFETGERSVLSYLMKPIVDQMAHSMRER